MVTPSLSTNVETVRALGHHRRSQKCPNVSRRGKLIDMSNTDPKYLLGLSISESDIDTSIDSEASLDNTAEDLMVEVEDTDDMDLEEALEHEMEVD